MIEIKFRAWDNVNDNMELNIHYLSSLNEYLHKDKYNVMQYAGQKDKNGKELFVGDIARFYEEPEEELFFHGIAKVIDTEIGWTWEIVEQGNEVIDSTSFWNEDFEVIGNIYENPQLGVKI